MAKSASPQCTLDAVGDITGDYHFFSDPVSSQHIGNSNRHDDSDQDDARDPSPQHFDSAEAYIEDTGIAWQGLRPDDVRSRVDDVGGESTHNSRQRNTSLVTREVDKQNSQPANAMRFPTDMPDDTHEPSRHANYVPAQPDMQAHAKPGKKFKVVKRRVRRLKQSKHDEILTVEHQSPDAGHVADQHQQGLLHDRSHQSMQLAMLDVNCSAANRNSIKQPATHDDFHTSEMPNLQKAVPRPPKFRPPIPLPPIPLPPIPLPPMQLRCGHMSTHLEPLVNDDPPAQQIEDVGTYLQDTEPGPKQLSDPTYSDIEDIARQFVHRLETKTRKNVGRLEASNRGLENRLRNADYAYASLQDRCDALQQEKQDLLSRMAEEEAKSTSFKVKAAKFKAFVGGLQSDITSLKQEADRYRVKDTRLAKGKDEHSGRLLKELSTGVETSTRLRNEALRACQDANNDLATAKARIGYLELEVNEKALRLSEEKDLRLQMQNRLTAADKAEDSLLCEPKSNHDDVLEHVLKIQATLRDANDRQGFTDMLAKTMAAVQTLNATQSSSVEDLLSVRGLIQDVSNNMAAYSRSCSADDNQSLMTQIDQALNNLKVDLWNREELVMELNTSREKCAVLEEKLRGSEARIADLSTHAESAVSAQTHLQEKNRELDASMIKLQAEQDTLERLQVELGVLRSELQAKSKTHEAAETDLASKNGELEELLAKHAELEEQFNSLQQDIEATGTTTNGKAQESINVDQLIESARANERCKLAKASKAMHDDQNARMNNRIRTAVKAEEKAKAQLEISQEQLKEALSRIEQLQTSTSSTSTTANARSAATQKTAEVRWKKVENLETTVRRLQSDCEARIGLEEHNMVLNQLREQEIKVVSLKAEVEELHQAADERSREVKGVRENLRLFQKVGDSPNALREQIRRTQQERDTAQREKQEQAEGHKRALQQIKATCKKDADDAQIRLDSDHFQNIEVLKRLIVRKDEEIQAKEKALQEKINSEQDFSTKLNASWQVEKQKHQQALAEVKERLAWAEAERDRVRTLMNEQIRECMSPGSTQAGPRGQAALHGSLAAACNADGLTSSQPSDARGAADCQLLVPVRTLNTEESQPSHGPAVEESQPVMFEPDLISSLCSKSSSQRDPVVVEESQQTVPSFSQRMLEFPSSSGSNAVESQLQQWSDTRVKSATPSFTRFDAGHSCLAEYTASQLNSQPHQKRATIPNIGSKRMNTTLAAPPSWRAYGTELLSVPSQNGLQATFQYKTPEPLESQSNVPSSSSSKIVASQQARPSKTYGDSGTIKERSSPRSLLEQAPPSSSKRKASQIENGRHVERKKRLITQQPQEASKPGRVSLSSFSQPTFSAQIGIGRLMAASSSQSSRAGSLHLRTQCFASARAPQTRSKSKIMKSRGSAMDARFAKDLSNQNTR